MKTQITMDLSEYEELKQKAEIPETIREGGMVVLHASFNTFEYVLKGTKRFHIMTENEAIKKVLEINKNLSLEIEKLKSDIRKLEGNQISNSEIKKKSKFLFFK